MKNINLQTRAHSLNRPSGTCPAETRSSEPELDVVFVFFVNFQGFFSKPKLSFAVAAEEPKNRLTEKKSGTNFFRATGKKSAAKQISGEKKSESIVLKKKEKKSSSEFLHLLLIF